MDAAGLLVYLETLRDRNVPLHKVELRVVCGDCDRYTIAYHVDHHVSITSGVQSLYFTADEPW